ncbi:MAG: hypothetical protein EXS05_11145 [Planctomycetaceae bacterium]|nr:hypothetical protein [Planctomycetaceae bacterium]
MSRLCLTLSRLCLTAWVGIGVFFVMALLRLRNPDLFSATALLNHPRVLFPLFYQFEFGLLGLALVVGAIARLQGAGRRTFQIGLWLAAAALMLATVDYLWVYRPLSEMIERPVLPPEFTQLHHRSRWINTAGLLIATAAACLALWPEPPRNP